jgi:hypothetical protein
MPRPGYTFNESYFNTVDTEEKAYFLGLLASDGYVSDKGTIAIGLSGKRDRVILERFKRAVGFEGPITSKQPSYPGSQRHYTVSLNSKQMAADLARHGIIPRKSLVYEFNDQLPEHLIRHYVRGVFDGDGSVSYRKDGSFMLGLIGSRRFIVNLHAYMAIRIGLKPHIEYCKLPRSLEIAQLKTGGNYVSLIWLDWMYRDAKVFLPRKEAKYQLCREVVAKRLSNIETLYNVRAMPEVMDHAKRCATLLDIELNLEKWNGLSLPPSEQSKIIEQYKAGWGIKHIKTHRICSNTIVRNTLKRNGIPIRGVTEQSTAQRKLTPSQLSHYEILAKIP